MSEPEGGDMYLPFRSMAILSDGSVFADIGTAIDQFDHQGKFVRRIGREGGGPGEFRRISTVTVLPGDSLVAAVDARRGRIAVFDVATGSLHRELTVMPFFAGQQWRWYGDTVVMPTKLSEEPFTTWVPRTDSVWSWGDAPDVFVQSLTAYSQGGEPSIVRRRAGWLAVFPADGRLFQLSSRGNLELAIEIPALRRRGVPSDIADTVRAIGASGTFRYAASLVLAIAELRNGSYAIVHLDTDPELNEPAYRASGGSRGITYRNTTYWITFVSGDLTRACPDNRILFEPDNLLVPYIRDDFIYFLNRSPASDSTALAVLHRFHLDDSHCSWVRVDAPGRAPNGRQGSSGTSQSSAP